MASNEEYTLEQDRKGMVWDLLMYVPTVAGLGVVAFMFWFDQNQSLAYLLFFLACFFFIQAVHRILGRLMLLPTAPIALDVSKKRVALKLRNSEKIELVKNLRYFSDFAGKSFGLTGIDMNGKQRQYVFHKGQFVDEAAFKSIGDSLKIFS